MNAKVEVLYFEGCPNHEPAVDLVRDVLAERGAAIRVAEVEVRAEDDVRSLRFLGSPSIRVNGVDIEPEAWGRSDFALVCRTYEAPVFRRGSFSSLPWVR